jgi:hypothetical protein
LTHSCDRSITVGMPGTPYKSRVGTSRGRGAVCTAHPTAVAKSDAPSFPLWPSASSVVGRRNGVHGTPYGRRTAAVTPPGGISDSSSILLVSLSRLGISIRRFHRFSQIGKEGSAERACSSHPSASIGVHLRIVSFPGELKEERCAQHTLVCYGRAGIFRCRQEMFGLLGGWPPTQQRRRRDRYTLGPRARR